MNVRPLIVPLAFPVLMLSCDRSPTTSAGATATTQERIEKDFKDAGQKVKQAADKAAKEADPALQKAREDAKDLVHKAAEKVAEQTAPAPPATQP
jgi:hypothetical protein